jgi:hypothetical protein
MRRSHLAKLLIGTFILAVTGCRTVGPNTIAEDRLGYNNAIACSWKQQTLLNIVRLRYADVPEFVDVASVVNGYEHEHTAGAGIGTELYPRDSISNFLLLDVHGSRTLVDRPTISYAPQTGSAFIRNLTNPIPPISILNLIESGYPADVVMELAVESINGLRNRGFSGALESGDPEFRRAVQIMRKAQASGHVSLRIVPAGNPSESDLVFGIRDENIDPELAAELKELRALLGLDPTVHDFRIVFGMLPSSKDEIAFRTRSVLRIMTYLALDVQVPEGHLLDGLAPHLGDMPPTTDPQFTVHSGTEPPGDSYAAVCYQGCWFWIDSRDSNSKRTMIYLKVLLALADTQERNLAPALTIQAN